MSSSPSWMGLSNRPFFTFHEPSIGSDPHTSMLWPQWVKYGNLKLTFTDFIDFDPENNPKFTISSKNGSDPDNTFQYLAKPKSNLLVLYQPRLNYKFEIKKQKKQRIWGKNLLFLEKMKRTQMKNLKV